MGIITSVHAREILDSSSVPAIETTVILNDGSIGTSSVPSMQKTTPHQTVEIRDTENKRYGGYGVTKAIENVNAFIAQKIVGMESLHQSHIDRALIELDGTEQKSRLGVNAVLSVSQAVARASAESLKIPLALYLRRFFSLQKSYTNLPIPMFSIIEEGKYGTGAVEFQEFVVIPASTKTYAESLEMGVGIYQATKRYLHDRNLSSLTSDKGGFSPYVATNRDALNLLKLVVEQSGYAFSLDVFLGIDCAANFFKRDTGYYLKDKGGYYSNEELVEFYKGLFNDFSLIYIGDPFAEEDWDGWKRMYSALGAKVTIAGDDLTATNPYRVQLAIANNVINGLVINRAQVGTITEAIAVIEIARFKKLKVIIANCQSLTVDSFDADFSVAAGADYVKFGAPTKERVVEYNRLMELQELLKQEQTKVASA